MYAYFKGTIIEKNLEGIVMEVGGIGYNIMTPPGKGYELPDVGEQALCYTYTSVREDALQLYGFARNSSWESILSILRSAIWEMTVIIQVLMSKFVRQPAKNSVGSS